MFSDELSNARFSARIASSGAREDRDARHGRGIVLDWWMLDRVGDLEVLVSTKVRYEERKKEIECKITTVRLHD
jgi:hypothetical protein